MRASFLAVRPLVCRVTRPAGLYLRIGEGFSPAAPLTCPFLCPLTAKPRWLTRPVC